MQLSNSGRVVLVDDSYAEVLPLLLALGQGGVPYVCYDGTIQNLPERPPGGIRFVFLDIELKGMAGQPPKTKAAGAISVLKRIIDRQNGPYVIVFWTKHHEVIDQVKENCVQEGIAPVAYLALEKAAFLENSDDCVRRLAATLDETLQSVDAFQLYVQWENILNDAGKQFVSQFSSMTSLGESWSRETSALFYSLYKSYVEKNEVKDPNEQFACACHLMNRSFMDVLEKLTWTDLRLPTAFRMTGGAVSQDTIAKIYSSLHLPGNFLSRPTCGSVYAATDMTMLNSLKHLCKEGKVPEEASLCRIIITPQCDLAQNKTLRVRDAEDKEHVLHRIVHGLLFPMTGALPEERGRFREKGKDSHYFVGPLWHQGKRWLLFIHFATLTAQSEDNFSDAPLFRLSPDLLFDLQSKVANDVNRLGKMDLE